MSEEALNALEAEEKAALSALDVEYDARRAELRRSFVERRASIDVKDLLEEVHISPPTPVPVASSLPPEPLPPNDPPPVAFESFSVPPAEAQLPSAPPPHAVSPPAPAPPSAPVQAVTSPATQAKMTLWEREQLERSDAFIEEERAERIRKLEQQRQAELAEARQREELWRVEDEKRAAAEAERRREEEAARAAAAAELVAKNKAEQEERDAAMCSEQQRLAAEKARQTELMKAKAQPSMQRQVSDDFTYAFEEGMEAKVKAFRQRGQGGDALLMRIDHDAGVLLIDEACKQLPSVEALAEKLEDAETEPRFLLYIHKVAHSDGRVQYPIAFFLYLPDQVPVHLKVLYTRPVVELADSFKVARHFTLEDPADLTVEWLEENMGIVRK